MSIPSLQVFMQKVHAATRSAACTFLLIIGGSSRLYAAQDPYFVFYNVAVSLTTTDLGLSSDSIANPQGSYQATSSWQGGAVSGTALPLTEYLSVSSVPRTHILFWQYINGKSNDTFSVSFQLTQPTLTSQAAPSSSRIVITSATPSTIERIHQGGSSWTFSGYGDLVLNISQASRAGLYTGGVITQTVTVL
jgi:hypothetical protein